MYASADTPTPAVNASSVAPGLRLRDRLNAYLALTKPTIVLLVALTGAAGAALEGSLLSQPLLFAVSLLLLSLAAGSANAFNQYFEREVDAVMTRTRKRRPLPGRKIHPGEALAFASLAGIGSTAGFWLLFNPLAALLSLWTILFYALFYTLYLKPRTPENIVIGGVAGSMGPLILWAAGAGQLAWAPVLMFAVIFFWTPPHFWSLAIYMKHDYKAVNYPMMPVVVGEKKTWDRALVYTALTVLTSMALVFFGQGWVYGAGALALNAWFARAVWLGRKRNTPLMARKVFLISIVYLLALFALAIVDVAVG